MTDSSASREWGGLRYPGRISVCSIEPLTDFFLPMH